MEMETETEKEYEKQQTVLSMPEFFSYLNFPYQRLDVSYLNLRYNLKDMNKVASILETHTSLLELNLSSTHVRDLGSVAISKALQSNAVLQSLWMYGNKITDIGAKAFAEMLKINHTLAKLDLGSNSITDKGVKSLAEALKVNSALVHLQLDHNHVEDQGCELLADALRINDSLAYLDIFGNNIGEVGATAVANALEMNDTLTHINLNDNNIRAIAVVSKSEEEERSSSLLRSRKMQVRRKSVFRQNKVQKVIIRIEKLLEKNRRVQKNAFAAALKSSEKAAWRRSKLMLIGEGMAGKTATVRSLLNESFDAQWKSTVGISMTEARTSSSAFWSKDSTKQYTMALVSDMAVGNFRKTVRRENKVGRLVTNIESAGLAHTNTASMQNKKRTQSDASKQSSDSYEFNQYLFVRAKNNKESIRLSIWDYGGQTVFHTLHHLFLTRYGVYLLVFSLVELREYTLSTTKALLFWLNSVQLHAPQAPILMVGTFLDQAEARDIETTEQRLKPIARQFPQVVSGADLAFFPIDNYGKEGTSLLRDEIQRITSEQEYVRFQVSIKWMRLLDTILESEKAWIGYTQAKALADEIGITSVPEFNQLLQLFHELGVVIYFTKTQALRGIITTKPQWLVDGISKVIRDNQIHRFDMDKVRNVGLEQDVGKLFDEGLATRDLLDYLWDRSHVDFLLDLMRHLLLLSNWKFGIEETMHLVPSMITADAHASGVEPMGTRCEFRFRFLPNGVFERLVCQCVEFSSKEPESVPPILFKNVCKIWLGSQCSFFLTRRANTICMYTENMQYCSKLLGIFLAMMRKLRDDVMGERLQAEIKVEVKGDMISFKSAKKKRCDPWFVEDTGAVSRLSKRIDTYF